MAPSGIPTVYRGRQFRSRLEARWAVFFDIVGWPYEYEPFELDGWIPDFLLLGHSPVLVEIKPVVEFPELVAEKVKQSRPDQEVLILGCTIPVTPFLLPARVGFGWLLLRHVSSGPEVTWSTVDALLLQYLRPHSGRNRFGFHGSFGPSLDRMSGLPLVGGQDRHWEYAGIDDVADSWVRAGNLIQWRGNQSIAGQKALP
jgi:hypothetical protein